MEMSSLQTFNIISSRNITQTLGYSDATDKSRIYSAISKKIENIFQKKSCLKLEYFSFVIILLF